MGVIPACLAAPFLALTTLVVPQEATLPTLEGIFKPPRLLGVRPTSAQVSAAGNWVTWRWAAEDAERPARDLWISATNAEQARVLYPASERVRTWWLPSTERLLVYREGWLEVVTPGQEHGVVPLLEVGDTFTDLTFLEDGTDRFLFQSGIERELWWVDPARGERRRLAEDVKDRSPWYQVLAPVQRVALFGRTKTPDKEPRRLHLVPMDGGTAREVPVVEGGRIEVSPSGAWVARTRQEAERPRELIMANYLSEAVTTVPVRNSLAGDDPAAVTVELTEVASGRSFAPPISGQDRFHLMQVAWAPHGERLLLERVDQDWHVRELLVVDTASRSVWSLFTETDPAWIGGPMQTSRWLGAGEAVFFSSEKSGFNHLYRVNVLGGEVTPVTQGAHEIQALAPLGESGTRFLLGTNAPDPAVKIYEVLDLSAGSRTRVTSTEGVASRAATSRDGSTLVFQQEFLGVPADLYRQSVTSPAGEPRRLTSTLPEALGQLSLPPPEIVEYQNPEDGQSIRALLYRPQPFDPTRKYPAVVFIHGAGYLQNVTRSMTQYAVNYLFHHRLARKGYVVLDADYRHSAGYGRDFRAAVHGFMGGKDLDDVAAAVPYLGSLGYVDTERVGTYGGSYGGFLTLMALFQKPEVFACGAALRSVTDWRTYHAWYTNPRLGDPKEDAENYRRSSPIDHAEGLTRPLLLLHGLQDSNVFAQDTIRLMEKLIQLGKDFDAMLYPSQNHGFTDPESWIDEYRRIERFMDRHLKEPRSGQRRSF